MKFDAQRAYHHMTQIAFPRKVGSEGECKARAYIVDQLMGLGLSVTEEPFHFTQFPAEVFPRLMSAIFIVGVLFTCWLNENQQTVWSAILCVGMLLIAIALTRWQRRLEWLYNVGKTCTSTNIVARNATASDERFDLIFVSHYDSKSQVLPIAVRAICYFVAIVGLISLTLLILIQIALKAQWNAWILWTIGACICLCLLLVQFNFTQNRSNGAFDNASGVGFLLELARCLIQNPPSPQLRLTFLFPSAEEYGMCGALRYIQRHATDYDPKRTWFINLDSVGANGKLTVITRYGLPPLLTSERLGRAICACGNALGVDVSEVYSPAGVGYDQLPIASRGFETVTLSAGGFGGAALKIHSAHDQIDLIHQDNLQKLGDFVLHFVDTETLKNWSST